MNCFLLLRKVFITISLSGSLNIYKGTMKKNLNSKNAIAFGIIFGTLVGILTGNLGLWLAVGVAIGAGMASTLAKKEKEAENDK